MKNIHDGNSKPHLNRGFRPISLKVCWKLYEIPRTPQKLNVWQPPPHGEGHWAISLRTIIDENCMKCTELHETHVVLFPTSPQRVEGLGSNAQNNVTSDTKILVNCPHLFPTERLSNISFLCRSGHFTQFLAKVFSLKIDSLPPTP